MAAPQLNALRVFESVARHLSFTRAARELSLSQGAVSYRIKQLEASLGFALFEREGRGVVLTPKGQELWRTVSESLSAIAHTLERLRSLPGAERITVGTTTYFASRWLSPRLMRFLEAHPTTTLRLQPTVGALHLGLDELDIAVRWGEGGWRDAHHELLFEAPLSPACNHQWARRLKGGKARPASLAGATLLHDDETRAAWRRWLDVAGLSDELARTGPVIPDPNVRVQAAIDGQGLALMDELVADEVRRRRLSLPFAKPLEGYGYYLCYRPRALENPAVASFRQWIREEARSPW